MDIQRRTRVCVAALGVAAMGILFGCARTAPHAVAHASDGGAAARDWCVHAPSDCAALTAACDALTASTVSDVGQRWQAVSDALQRILRDQHWLRDRFAFHLLHPIEGTLTACGIRDDRVAEILAVIHAAAERGNATMRGVLHTEEETICEYVSAMAYARQRDAPTDLSRFGWTGWCRYLLTGFSERIPNMNGVSPPRIPSTPLPVSVVRDAPTVSPPPTPPRPAPPHDQLARCNGIAVIREHRAAFSADTLSGEQWIAFGRALAECVPEREPWVSLGLPGGRQQYADELVLPFMLRDGTRSDGSLRITASTAYDVIITAWEIE